MNTELIKKIANRICEGRGESIHMGMEEFDWIQGVGLFGVFCAYQKTNDKKYLDFTEKWCDSYLNRYYEKQTVNTTIPFLTAFLTGEALKTDKYEKICFDVADYLLYKAPKTVIDGLEHTVIQPVPAFREQMWADTLFMACLFLVKMGKYDKKYSDFAKKQYILHNKVLFDETCGLYYHGYRCTDKSRLGGIHWGRANAWMIITNTLLIEWLGDFEEKEEICGYIKKHAEGIKNHMREDGTFGTVTDEPTSYSETSAAAGFAAGIKKGIELGILDKSYKDVYNKIAKALKSNISEDGTVLGVSEGTPIMPTVKDYVSVSKSQTLYGQTLAILAL